MFQAKMQQKDESNGKTGSSSDDEQQANGGQVLSSLNTSSVVEVKVY